MDHWSLILKIIYLTINFFETQEYAVLRMDDRLLVGRIKKNYTIINTKINEKKEQKTLALCWNVSI